MSGTQATSLRRTVLYSGTVQGVGFRYTTERTAGGFAVTGQVRNLSNGRVEMIAEGEPTELGRFEAAVADALGHYITGTDSSDGPATGQFDSFAIAS